MVTKGIVLGNIISADEIEVNKAKIDLIIKLPTPKTIKDVRSFLGMLASIGDVFKTSVRLPSQCAISY